MTAQGYALENDRMAVAEDWLWLGQAIRQGREAMGWKQRHLAAKLDVGESLVRRWESGRGLPNLENYRALCRLFGWAEPDVPTGAHSSCSEHPRIVQRRFEAIAA